MSENKISDQDIKETKEEIIEKNYEQPYSNENNGCNCNDEFKTRPCPIHARAKIDHLAKKVIITDDLMVKEKIHRWSGHCFVCPRCKLPSVMHFFKYCSNCGVELEINSKIVTDIMNKLINTA